MKKYKQSVIIIKTESKQILGAYSPETWINCTNLQGRHKEIKFGVCFLYFFEEDEIKICN